MAEKWSKLTDSEKNVYLSSAKIDIEKYKQELTKWEIKMVRQGHLDVVRNEALIEPNPHTKVRRSRTTSE